jgi:putative intracellular protease/amidase
VRPIADIMGVAEDSPYDVVLVGEERRHVHPRGIDVGELAPLGSLREVDTVIVPGISEPLSRRSDDLLGSLSAASESGARMVSFCGGAFLLAQAGILDGRSATTRWLLAPEFRKSFPRVRLQVDGLYVDDPPVHTSGGIFAATDLARHIIALDRGQALAKRHQQDPRQRTPHRSGGQSQFIKDSMRARSGSVRQGSARNQRFRRLRGRDDGRFRLDGDPAPQLREGGQHHRGRLPPHVEERRVDMPSASFRTDPDDLDATDGEELRGGAGWSNGHL